MFVLLGAVCLFSKIDCTPVGIIGKPYTTREKCMAVKHKFDAQVGPVAWLDAQFECVEDEAI